jgi:hypothetical protein
MSECHILASTFAFKVNSHLYTMLAYGAAVRALEIPFHYVVGRCTLESS